MNPVQEFCAQIYSFLTKQPNCAYNPKSNLIKKHKDKLSTYGDFSFPIDIIIWKKHIDKEDNEHFGNILEYACSSADHATAFDALKTASGKWQFQICRILLENNRCLLFIQRHDSFKKMISLVLDAKNYGVLVKANKLVAIAADPIEDELDNRSITEHRIRTIKSVLANLVFYSKYTLADDAESPKMSFRVTYKSTNNDCGADQQKIICGIVTNAKNGNKLSDTTAAEYLKKRSNDMQLIAMHKYGLRVKNEEVFIRSVNQLGQAAVVVDLLEVKHSSPVAMNINGCSSSKGAGFILYNSARLETLFRTFEEKTASGYFPKLPDLVDTDLALLTEEEEWELFFNHIIEFPNLIEKSIGDLENGRVSPHLICGFLSDLAGTFSVYYRRVRILTENRPQLVPKMFARFQFLKCLRIVLNKTLNILNIEPIAQM